MFKGMRLPFLFPFFDLDSFAYTFRFFFVLVYAKMENWIFYSNIDTTAVLFRSKLKCAFIFSMFFPLLLCSFLFFFFFDWLANCHNWWKTKTTLNRSQLQQKKMDKLHSRITSFNTFNSKLRKESGKSYIHTLHDTNDTLTYTESCVFVSCVSKFRKNPNPICIFDVSKHKTRG